MDISLGGDYSTTVWFVYLVTTLLGMALLLEIALLLIPFKGAPKENVTFSHELAPLIAVNRYILGTWSKLSHSLGTQRELIQWIAQCPSIRHKPWGLLENMFCHVHSLCICNESKQSNWYARAGRAEVGTVLWVAELLLLWVLWSRLLTTLTT